MIISPYVTVVAAAAAVVVVFTKFVKTKSHLIFER